MSEDTENQRFKYINNDDPVEDDKRKTVNDKNKLNEFVSNLSIMGIQGGLGWRSQDQSSLNNSRATGQQISEQQRLKDRKIRKLTNINKHYLEQLKQQNDQLTKLVNKQKFRIPKKSGQKSQPKNQQVSKQVQAIKKQLENAYGQIQFYKQTISVLKIKQIPSGQQEKIDLLNAKLKDKNQDIEKLQQQIKIQKSIKAMQNKQLQKIQNEGMNQLIKKLDQDIKNAKIKLKQAKKTLTKREELQKKQHMYLGELEGLIRRRNQEEESEPQSQFMKKNELAFEQQITQLQWKQIKERLAQQKKKYEQYGKKLTYQNYIKSKQSKAFEQLQLKYKEKAKVLQKLKSKLDQVNKLARLRPKPEVLQRVDLKMQKLKDILSRQNTVQMQNINKIKTRVQSEDVRDFKKWQLQHAQRQIDPEEKIYNIKNQSEEEQAQSSAISNYFPSGTPKGEARA